MTKYLNAAFKKPRSVLVEKKKAGVRFVLTNTLVGNNNTPPQKNVESLYGIIPTQDAKPSFGRRPKDGFVSKLVSKFSPSQKHVHLSEYIKHHIGGGRLPKITCEIL